MTDKQEDEKQKTAFINAKRRGFLQGAAVASGAVATGAAVAATDAADSVEIAEAQVKASGYQVTDHIKKYYKRARF